MLNCSQMKNTFFSILFLLVVTTFSVFSQSVNVTIIYNGAQSQGCCNVCGADYTCFNNTGGCGTTAACGSRNFTDPVPAGNIVTGVSITYFAAGCHATSVASQINGVAIAATPSNSQCACGSCTAYTSGLASFPCPTGLPSYNYGGVNSFKCCPNGAFCPQRVVITLSYTAKSVAPTSATASPNPSCGGPVTLTEIGGSLGAGASWKWYSGSCGGTAEGTGASITVTPSSTITYFVRAEGGGCGNTACASVTVTFNTLSVPPTSATASPSTTCGGPTTLTVVGGSLGTGATWDWFSGSCGGTAAGTGATITVSPTITTTYFVRAGGGCGNTACVSVLVTVNPVPFAIATPASPTICSGDTTNIALSSFTPGTTFTWTVVQNGVTGASAGSGALIAQTLTATGTSGTAVYSITPTANGCPGAPINVTVTVNPRPTATAAPGAQTICSGILLAVNLSSTTPGATFAWTVVQTGVAGGTSGSGSTITDSLYATGSIAGTAVYKITPTASGCSGTPIYDTITVNPDPGSTATATPSAPSICSGATTSIILTSSTSGTTFAWTATQNGVTGASAGTGSTIAQTLTTTALVPGNVIYTVSAVANGCTSNQLTVTVTVNPVPTGIVTPTTQTICSGDTTLMTLTSNIPGTTFPWTASMAGVTGSLFGTDSIIRQIITTTGSTAGTAIYTITPTLGGCPGPALTVTVTVNPSDNASFVYTSATYCQSGSDPTPAITGLPGGTFSSTPVGLSLNPSTGKIILSTSALGPYTLCYTTNGACPSSSCITMTIDNTTPFATHTYPGSPFCVNGIDPYPLFGTGASAGTFSAAPAGLTFVHVNTGQIDLSASLPGTYTVTNYIPPSGTCGAATGTSTVVITAADDASFFYSSATYCQSGTDPTPTITGLPGGTFSSIPAGLSINPTTGTIHLATSAWGVYTLSYATFGPCPNSSSITMTIDSITPSANFTYAGSPFCQYGNNPSPIFASGASAGTFSATPSGLVFVHVNTGQINLPSSAPGTYVVTNTIPASGSCLAVTATATVVINAGPVVTATPGGSITLCTGTTVPVAITLTSSMPGTTFTWTASEIGLSGATPGSGASINQTLTFVGPGVGTATYTITPNAGGCVGLPTPVNITVHQSPVPDTTTAVIGLANCGTATGSVSGITTVSGLAPIVYQWFDSQNNLVGSSSNLTNVGPGQYYLTITDANNCPVTTGPYTVAATPPVVAAFTPNPTTGETPLTVNFTNNSVGASTYAWSFGTGDVSTATSPSYVYNPLGSFYACLVAISATNCTDTICDSIHIYINSVFIVPNIFTPNNDGSNDVFAVKSNGLKKMDAEIYNRWGQKIYEWHTPLGGWDGHTGSGVLASAGTYYYIIKATGIDAKEYFEKGSFSLVTDEK